MRPAFLASIPLASALLALGCNTGPVVCSTNSEWSEGDHGSPLMHPGGDCIGCHRSEGEGPRFTLAGTVMAADNDDTDCNGAEGVSVVIKDAANQTFTMVTNAAGNFYTTRPITFPYEAKVVRNGKVKEMDAKQRSGNCAACHTAEAGRIVAP